jgi:hypothetical protein
VANLRDRIILFPRYTTLAGARDFMTLPINVTAYERGDVVIWIGDIVGPTTPGPVGAAFEESTDQVHWATCGGTGSGTLTAGSETTLGPQFTKPWMRFLMSVAAGAGGDPVLSCYAVGWLERRKGASPPP